MLAVVVLAALSPNLGAVPAQTNCPYGICPSSSPGVPIWVWGVIGAIIIAALLGLIFVFTRRRRRPPSAAAPVQPWQGGAGPGSAPPPPPAPPASPPPAPPAAAPAYLETPEDVGHAPPSVSPSDVAGVGAAGIAGAAGGAAAAAGAAGESAEPDIDSLMAELDRISGEILKRAPKKGTTPATEPTEEEPPD